MSNGLHAKRLEWLASVVTEELRAVAATTVASPAVRESVEEALQTIA